MATQQQELQHLYWRASFGPDVSQITSEKLPSRDDAADALLKDSKSINYLAVIPPINSDDMMKDIKKSFTDIADLNISWLNQMATGSAALREKMTLFWHNHFACKIPVGYYIQNQNNTLRRYALGSFSDLLMAVSKDAAMLQFLNNQQNRRQHPNENFGREVMELFTLGRGNYSEEDVKNVARAFTGWQHDLQGNFRFNPRIHDDGIKSVFGRRGNFSGEDIIDMLIDNRQTSIFITTKIYRHFVNESVGEDIVRELSKNFYESHYDISLLMKKIFSSDWFYDDLNIGSHIKSPIELMAGMHRTLPVAAGNTFALIRLQKLLGQVLFSPPNVAGWPLGRAWVDSASLALRMKLPEYFFNEAAIEERPKPDAEEEEMRMANSTFAPQQRDKRISLNAQVDWSNYTKAFDTVSDKELLPAIRNFLVQSTQINVTDQTVMTYCDTSSRDAFIRTVTVRLMSLPEYQLC